MEPAKTINKTNDPYMFAWERAKARLDAMNKEEKRQIFVNAGILTQKGEITKPFEKVFMKTTHAAG